MINNDEEKKTGKRKYARLLTGRDLKASTLGWELALPIVAGPVIGYFIDDHFQTKPIFTLIFFFWGLVTGVYFLIKFIRIEWVDIQMKEQENKKKK